MTELISIVGGNVYVKFPDDNVTIIIDYAYLDDKWSDLVDAIDNNLEFLCNCGSGISGYRLEHRNGKLTISTYVEKYKFGMTACISLSDLNIHILKQLEELCRCAEYVSINGKIFQCQ